MFACVSRLFGRPLFWLIVVGALGMALLLNIVTYGRFDPGMNYSNFIQNYVQVIALAVTTVAAVSLADQRHGQKLDALHSKVDALHEKVDGQNAQESP